MGVKALVKEGRLCSELFYIFLPGFQIGSGWNRKLCCRILTTHTCRSEVQVIDFRYKRNLSPRETSQSLTPIFYTLIIMNSVCIFPLISTCSRVLMLVRNLNAVKALYIPGNFQAEFPGFQLIHDPEWQWNPFSFNSTNINGFTASESSMSNIQRFHISRLSRDGGFYRMLGQKVGWDPFAKSWGPSMKLQRKGFVRQF